MSASVGWRQRGAEFGENESVLALNPLDGTSPVRMPPSRVSDRSQTIRAGNAACARAAGGSVRLSCLGFRCSRSIWRFTTRRSAPAPWSPCPRWRPAGSTLGWTWTHCFSLTACG